MRLFPRWRADANGENQLWCCPICRRVMVRNFVLRCTFGDISGVVVVGGKREHNEV